MDADLDFAIALSLQQAFDRETQEEPRKHERAQKEWPSDSCWDPKSIVDKSLELSDPNPNIHDLFVQYDAMFFWRKLVSSGVAVRWSPRMTLCAGVCVYEGRGGLCSIRLSQPLLKLRPRQDLVQTLLHEMIHAYLFVTENYRDHDGHGPKFLSHMHRINEMSGANITVYHSFHDEVREYRQHWWKCNGPCQFRPPYYGLVKRSMNRAPSPRDPWWSQHQKTCGGTYEKIKEPENYGKKKTTKRSKGGDGKKPDKSMNIKDLFKKNEGAVSTKSESGVSVSEVKPFEGTGHRLCDPEDRGVSSAGIDDRLSMREKMLMAAEKRQHEAEKHRNLARKRPRDDQGKVSPTDSNSHLKKAAAANEDIRKYFPDTHTNPKLVTKKPRLDSDVQIIVLDPADSPKVQDKPRIESPNLSNFTSQPESESDVIIDLSKEAAGPSSAVLVVDRTETNDSVSEVIALNDTADYVETDDDDDDDLVEIASGSGSGSPTIPAGDLDLKTCPVCGMSNIPKAIINTHIAFCFDAEEESQLVDDDNL